MPRRTPSWYADPDDPALARWHDGRDWTEFTMVIAEWNSPEAPPPPAGWTPPASPTEGLTPAFGAGAPARSTPPEPEPQPEPEPAPTTTAAGSPEPATDPEPPEVAAPSPDPAGAAPEPRDIAAASPDPLPAAPRPADEPAEPPQPDGDAARAPEAGPDAAGDDATPPATPRPDDLDEAARRSPAPAPGEPGTRAFGAPSPPGTRAFGGPADTPDPGRPDDADEPDGADRGAGAEGPRRPDFEDLPRTGGVRIDAPVAEPDPGPAPELDPDADVGRGPVSGSVPAVGPEAPGIDWGEGPQVRRPVRRPSGWHLDEDGELVEDDGELPRPTLGHRYRHAPVWVRVAIPVVLVGIVALAIASFLGGDGGGDEGADTLFRTRDGTLDEEALDEPGMDDALTRARERGAPAEINDKDLAALVKGVCTAARRTLVSLNLSQALLDTGLDHDDLGSAATAIGNGALEYCPEQEASLGQVVSVLITRTQRMLATSTTS